MVIVMANKIFNLPEKRSSRTQTHIITLPNLKEITKISVNTGSVSIEKIDGDKVTIKVSGGSHTRRVLTGGSYTPSDSKTVKTQTYSKVFQNSQDMMNNLPPKTQNYNQGGYSGTLSREGSLVSDKFPTTYRYWYTGTVTRPSSDTRTYDYYYQYNVTVDYIDNSPPSISGNDEELGDITDGFERDFTFNDADGDKLSVVVRLNNTEIIDNATLSAGDSRKVSITREKLYSLPLNQRNVIEIEVRDPSGEVAKRYIYFTRINTVPQISTSLNNSNLGRIHKVPNFTYNISDKEGDNVRVTILLNDVEIKTIDKIEQGKDFNIDITDEIWMKVKLGKGTIVINAKDAEGGENSKTITFEKIENTIIVEQKEPYKLEVMPNIIVPSIPMTLPPNFYIKVLVCNNGFDDYPTWEDCTDATLKVNVYTFKNKTKTEDKWGLKYKIGISTEEGELNEL